MGIKGRAWQRESRGSVLEVLAAVVAPHVENEIEPASVPHARTDCLGGKENKSKKCSHARPPLSVCVCAPGNERTL